MAIHLEILRQLAALVVHYPHIVTFFSGIISEELLVFLAILSGRGILSFWIVFVFGILGIMISDSIIFAVGRSRFGEYIENRFFPEKNMDRKIDFVNRRSSFFYILVSKFVWGTRMASIFYFSVKKMKYRFFVFYDTVSLFIWAGILLSAGWLAGKGFDRVLRLTRGVERLFLLILITVLVIFVLDKLAKFVLKKESKHVK